MNIDIPRFYACLGVPHVQEEFFVTQIDVAVVNTVAS
jgi:hypothetical protein